MCSILPFLGVTCLRTRSCNNFWSNTLGLCRVPSSENCGDYDAGRGRLSSDQAGKAQPVAVPVGESLTITLAFLDSDVIEAVARR